nr:hypothetical protein [Streptomyces sp. TLI_55]
MIANYDWSTTANLIRRHPAPPPNIRRCTEAVAYTSDCCATIPNWCITLKPPRTSHTVEMLAMDAPENRMRSTVQAVKCLPVGGTPANSPRQVPDERRKHTTSSSPLIECGKVFLRDVHLRDCIR